MAVNDFDDTRCKTHKRRNQVPQALEFATMQELYYSQVKEMAIRTGPEVCPRSRTVARPLHDRHTSVARPLHDRCATVTRPLHDRCTTVARSLRDCYTTVARTHHSLAHEPSNLHKPIRFRQKSVKWMPRSRYPPSQGSLLPDHNMVTHLGK